MKINDVRKSNVSWLMAETLNQRRVWLTSWRSTRQEIHALDAVIHSMVCDILKPLHQLLDVFWCPKCFDSGLPCTVDTGQQNHYQSPGWQRERHSLLTFWDSPCALHSCSVIFHVSTTTGWLTRPEVVRDATDKRLLLIIQPQVWLCACF